MRKKLLIAAIIIVVIVGVAITVYADRRSCICYGVGSRSVERPITDEITNMYEPAPGTFTLTRYTCRHNKSMWLRIFWDEGYYMISEN
nr:hypothetical protein [Clostridia bacterium]